MNFIINNDLGLIGTIYTDSQLPGNTGAKTWTTLAPKITIPVGTYLITASVSYTVNLSLDAVIRFKYNADIRNSFGSQSPFEGLVLSAVITDIHTFSSSTDIQVEVWGSIGLGQGSTKSTISAIRIK